MAAINVDLGISRTQSSKGPDRITITLTDEASGTRFVEVTMTMEQFAQAITTLRVYVPAEVRGLENVGKRKVTEWRTIELPSRFFYSDMNAVLEWLSEHGKEPGWIVDPYLGSQRSVSRVDGKAILNYSVYKYVEQQATAE